MHKSTYRAGLIVLGLICATLTPLAVAAVVPKWVTITALAAVVAWILIDVASHKNKTTAMHEPERTSGD